MPAENTNLSSSCSAANTDMFEHKRVGSPLADAKISTVSVYVDAELEALCKPYVSLKPRDQVQEIEAFLNKPVVMEKMMALYGLRRTGKTVMMYQEAYRHLDDSVYILCDQGTSISQLESLVREYLKQGKKFFFIDEITFCSDFAVRINIIPPLSGMGARIVCAGTDSFGFHMVRHLLYERVYYVHTTYISYCEFYRLKGGSLDDYIKHGGFFLEGDVDISDPSSTYLPYLADEDDVTLRHYLDTSIAQNILNAFKMIEDSDDTKYQALYVAYELGLLPSMLVVALNRQGFSFVAKQLQKCKPQSLAHPFKTLSSKVSRWRLGDYYDKEQHLTTQQLDCISLILQDITSEEFIDNFYASLDVNLEFRGIDSAAMQGYIDLLGSYLEILDVVSAIKQVNLTQEVDKSSRQLKIFQQNTVVHIFSQMGMMYGYVKQAIQLIDAAYSNGGYFDPIALHKIKQEIETVALGEFLEVAVLIDVSRLLGNAYHVFKCQFDLTSDKGEFDMVIQNSETLNSYIFEIKHSDKAVPEQAKHLLNPDFCKAFTDRFGAIVSRTVLYTGEDSLADCGVRYINVSHFLADPAKYLRQIGLPKSKTNFFGNSSD